MPANTMKAGKGAASRAMSKLAGKGGTGTQIINGDGIVGHMGDDGEFLTEGASNKFSAKKSGMGGL